jgi:hypothetical protein
VATVQKRICGFVAFFTRIPDILLAHTQGSAYNAQINLTYSDTKLID